MLIDQIRTGRLTLWADSRFSGRALAREMTGMPTRSGSWHRFPEIPIYFGFSRDVPDTTGAVLPACARCSQEEKNERGVSSYDTITGRYIPSIGLAPISYLTEEWAPFNYAENGVPSGISVENPRDNLPDHGCQPHPG